MVELEIHVCCFGFGVWMPPFDFVSCVGIIFVKFICICLTDLATGQNGLQLMSPLSTVTFSVLLNRCPTGIFSIIEVCVKGIPISPLLCFLVMKMMRRMIVGAPGSIIIRFPGGRRMEISRFIMDDTELSYLNCLLLSFKTPN